ncbi:dienelactone hydrolase family protein [Mucilaginibacter sp. BJC16-A38]|uniref:alpha/beta hydrolase n=1 Tax=Mucilaginibacter phenanthrenivorans TaxID=1234842 RepID=UPI002158160D|nr:dienelactone hydrolase family protein [Mucilaginibacter phenanthrenivorans]MCR8556536.1 dienelactone hydrolase family protein [Mucilaginibacter phenanthrenivorans]
MNSYDRTLYFGEMFPKTIKAIMMVHGKGSEAADIVNSFEGVLPINDYYIVAPNADRHTWYPQRFLAPQEENEPMLGNAISLLNDLVNDLTATGYERENIFILGFSQGACLALEFAARNAGKFGGIFALSGGLIGDILDSTRYKGDFQGSPIFLGCSDSDSHIPPERVHESAAILKNLGANVFEKIYPGMGHTVNKNEIDEISNILK